MSKVRYRSVWISDTHLGLKEARTEFLLDFLTHLECDTLYLAGDIIDLWKMRTGLYWPQINNEIVRTIMRMARQGTRVVYVPGNHDEIFRDYVEMFFGGIEVQQEAIHETADGRRFLVIHGDEFDCVVMHNKWLAYVGSEAYDFLLWVNRWFNLARRKLGLRYWSLSAFLKNKVKEAVQYIGNYEEAVVRKAREDGMDGVICGHIHHAALSDFDGITYVNCGDWVESCTAVAEDEEGRLRIIHWADESFMLLADPAHDEAPRTVTVLRPEVSTS
ncbi:MAG: UDP-2,3-diacylglucosamine diphosphatase [Gammaproteobacteria bacterium]